MIRPLLIFFALSLILSSCVSITRTEEDVYSRTNRDTTYVSYVHNDSRNEDYGVTRPSKKVLLNERKVVLEDSIVTREYPNFIRVGLFEAAGLFGGDGSKALNNGIFGVHPNPFAVLDENNQGTDGFVPGGLYRIMFFEKRLRWFRDAPNWTYGFTAFEMFAPDAQLKNSLIGIPAMHFRWRYYLRDKIPYQSVMLGASLGAFPSMYGNLEAQFEFGSIAGFNARAYLGYAVGYNSANGFLDQRNEFHDGSSSPSIFYTGLGVSLLDFKNVVPETYEEYKNMEHSGWNIGLMQLTLVGSSTGKSFLTLNDDDPTANSLIKGGILRLVNTSVALPILNNKFYAGTSLMNLMILGADAGGIGFLPVRLGYMQTILPDNLIAEPFVEYNYYPSNFFHIGAKLNLTSHEVISDRYNIALAVGYANGNFLGSMNTSLIEDLGDFRNFADFSAFYFGINIGINDRIFYPHELRYNK